jgi:hypothetical protein
LKEECLGNEKNVILFPCSGGFNCEQIAHKVAVSLGVPGVRNVLLSGRPWGAYGRTGRNRTCHSALKGEINKFKLESTSAFISTLSDIKLYRYQIIYFGIVRCGVAAF